MPTYAYRCRDCGHEFEQRQKMADDPLTDCPNCEGSIKRVINSIGVVFKGSGFYVTDNKGKNSTEPSSAGKKTASSDDSSSDSSSSDSGGSSSDSDNSSSESKSEKKPANKKETAVSKE